MFFDGKEMTKFYQDKEDAEIAKALEDGDKSEKKIEKEEKKEKKDSVKQAEKPEKLVLDLENRGVPHSPPDTLLRKTRRLLSHPGRNQVILHHKVGEEL